LDVIFNSIEGLHSDGRVRIQLVLHHHHTNDFTKYRPIRLHGIEIADPTDAGYPHPNLEVPADEPALAEVLAEHLSNSPSDTDIDPTS